MSMRMMIARGVVVVNQTAGQQRIDRLVGTAAHARVEADTRLRQSCPRSCADTATKQRIHSLRPQKIGERTMTTAQSRNDLAVRDGSLFDGVQLKLGGMAEVLKNLSVFIRNCYDHAISSFRCFAVLERLLKFFFLP